MASFHIIVLLNEPHVHVRHYCLLDLGFTPNQLKIVRLFVRSIVEV